MTAMLGENVVFQVTLLHSTVGTVRASVRPLPGMSTEMLQEVVFGGRAVGTEGAGKRLLFRMGAHVDLEVRQDQCRVGTVGAWVHLGA